MSAAPDAWIRPDWPAPANVRALVTTRDGGVSSGPYCSMNLALHVHDNPAEVAQNRARLAQYLGVEHDDVCWLEQVHGTRVIEARHSDAPPRADAAFTRAPGRVCVVMTADCLPVLLCDRAGRQVAAVHAGWRGLANGIVEAALDCFVDPEQVIAWLGPAIGPEQFEVGGDVRDLFCAGSPQAARGFNVLPSGKFLADIYLLARQRLAALGVHAIYGGGLCTVSDAARFFSYRRQGDASGRMASLIWLESACGEG